MPSMAVNPYLKNQRHYFALDPREAAIAAFCLYTMGNHHEEQWEQICKPVLCHIGRDEWLCGNWQAVPVPDMDSVAYWK